MPGIPKKEFAAGRTILAANKERSSRFRVFMERNALVDSEVRANTLDEVALLVGLSKREVREVSRTEQKGKSFILLRGIEGPPGETCTSHPLAEFQYRVIHSSRRVKYRRYDNSPESQNVTERFIIAIVSITVYDHKNTFNLPRQKDRRPPWRLLQEAGRPQEPKHDT